MLYTPETPLYDPSLDELPEVSPLEGLREYLRFVNNMHIGTPDREEEWNTHRRTADAYGADLLGRMRRKLAGSAEEGTLSRALSLEVGDFESQTLPHDIAAYYKALHLSQSRLHEVAVAEFQPQVKPSVLRLAGFAIRKAVFRAIS